MIQCPVCNKEFKKLTNAHLKTHGYFNSKTFGIDYPLAKIANDEIYKKNGLVGASISKRNILEQLNKRIKLYLDTPNKCKYCKKELSYKKRYNKHCNASCSAKANNVNHTKKRCFSENALNNIRVSNAKKKKVKTIVLLELECKICEKKFNSKTKRKTCSEECKRKSFSITAKKSNLGGNHNRKANWYQSQSAGKVWLESSYEVEVAKELDKNGVNWLRPKYLPYKDEYGVSRKYYGDFYLNDYDVYLDPKNSYLIGKDREKIERVKTQNNVKIFILTREELSWNIIKNKIK